MTKRSWLQLLCQQLLSLDDHPGHLSQRKHHSGASVAALLPAKQRKPGDEKGWHMSGNHTSQNLEHTIYLQTTA